MISTELIITPGTGAALAPAANGSGSLPSLLSSPLLASLSVSWSNLESPL